MCSSIRFERPLPWCSTPIRTASAQSRSGSPSSKPFGKASRQPLGIPATGIELPSARTSSPSTSANWNSVRSE